MKLGYVMFGSIGKGEAEVVRSLGSDERLQLQPQSVLRRIQEILSMAAAQNYEPDAVRQRFAQQITYERTWLPDLFRSHLCVITRIDYNAEDCLWIGYTNDRRSLLKPVSERAEVCRRVGVGRRDQGMA